MSGIKTPEQQAHQEPTPLVEPQRAIKGDQAHWQKRPFLNKNGRRVVRAGAVLTAVALGTQIINAFQQPEIHNTPASIPIHTQTLEGYVAPNPLEPVNLPPKAETEKYKDVRELYTGTYEISKGAVIRDARTINYGGDNEPIRGTGEIIPWDTIKSVEGVDLNGSQKFDASNSTIYYGYDSATGSLTDGLWMGFEAVLINGDKQNIYISINPQNHDFLKTLETPLKGFFVGLNPDNTVTDPNEPKKNHPPRIITPNEFNKITVPSNS